MVKAACLESGRSWVSSLARSDIQVPEKQDMSSSLTRDNSIL